MYLPFWYTKFTDKDDPKSLALLNQFAIDIAVANRMQKITNMISLGDFVGYYRANRASKETGLFSPSEVTVSSSLA